MNLNAEQQAAAEVNSQNALILAGPGTGKTTALVGRYAHLIEKGCDPKTILCCTFAKKAAEELKGRIQQQTGIASRALPIGTFHSLAFRLLKSDGRKVGLVPPDQVLLQKERLQAISEIKKSAVVKALYKDLHKELGRPSVILSHIDKLRDRLVDPEDASIEASESGRDELIAHAEVYSQFEQWLTESGKIDFQRMIQWACKLLVADANENATIGKRYSHILIDEYQDINEAQKVMVDGLLAGGASQWAVGDDDQAIYGWRGSSLDYLLNFPATYADTTVVNLVRNYRSGRKIVQNAMDLVARLSVRHEKTLVADTKNDGVIKLHACETEQKEATKVANVIQERAKAGVAYSDMAVLARTNLLPTTIIDTLIEKEIPAVLKDGVRLFAETEAQELITALATACGIKPEKGWNAFIPTQVQKFAHKIADDSWAVKVKALATLLVKVAPPKLSEDQLIKRVQSIQHYRDYLLEFEGPAEVFRRIRRSMTQPADGNGVHVGTIHSAKGLEWDTVIVIGWEDDALPHQLNKSFKKVDEERRLAYVAVTRAKQHLALTYAAERHGEEKTPSRFLDDMRLADDGVAVAATKPSKVKHAGQRSSKETGMTPEREAQMLALLSEQEAERKAAFEKRLQQARRRDEQLTRAIKAGEQKGDEQDRAFYREVNAALVSKGALNRVADGSGPGMAADIIDADTGFLMEAGYSVVKDGPSDPTRHMILADVFHGRVAMPDEIRESVVRQWGEPGSLQRLQKMRNSINVSLGRQKARKEPSRQAIEKWESDVAFIDQELKPNARE